MFGENLAELRKESGYDQKKPGELLGVSHHRRSQSPAEKRVSQN